MYIFKDANVRKGGALSTISKRVEVYGSID